MWIEAGISRQIPLPVEATRANPVARGGGGVWGHGSCVGFEMIGFQRVDLFGVTDRFDFGVLPDGSVSQPMRPVGRVVQFGIVRSLALAQFRWT